jgi:indolepyruvate ferredoxin oxidoreductase
MAIRHAVATNTTITYKILYNDAVAMTGGQPHDGNVRPWTISQQVHAEGVRRIALVSDDPDKYPIGTEWAPGVTFHHRSALDDVQRDLREWKGVSVLIYDQTCAAEKRRRRKRGTFPDPASACSSTRPSARAAATARCSRTASASRRSRPSSAPSAPSTSRPATRTSPA